MAEPGLEVSGAKPPALAKVARAGLAEGKGERVDPGQQQKARSFSQQTLPAAGKQLRQQQEARGREERERVLRRPVCDVGGGCRGKESLTS